MNYLEEALKEKEKYIGFFPVLYFHSHLNRIHVAF